MCMWVVSLIESLVQIVQTNKTHTVCSVLFIFTILLTRSIKPPLKNLKIPLKKRFVYFGSLFDLILSHSVSVFSQPWFHAVFCFFSRSYQACPLPPQTFTEGQHKHTLPVSCILDRHSSCLCMEDMCLGFRIEGGSCAPNSKDLT